MKKLAAGIVLSGILTSWNIGYAAEYIVQPGDSLWTISQKSGISVAELKKANDLASDLIYAGQRLTIPDGNTFLYTVQPGDTLWKLSNRFQTTVKDIMNLNGLKGDLILVGDVLKIKTPLHSIQYTVRPGDTLWIISNIFHITVQDLRKANGLSGDYLDVGQILQVPLVNGTQNKASGGFEEKAPTPVYQWPSVTYVVQAGDTVSSIAKKFGVSASDILKYNYMDADDWFSAGQTIAISGYAPRAYAVTPGEASSPSTRGKLVDWFLDGQYLVKRGDVFTITDVATGKQFKVKMLGGYNHADVEPLTASDTMVMKSIFNNNWTWTPRPVVIFHNGMNIAASLSGKPHDVDSIAGNGVTGHFDLYMQNSKPQSGASDSYVAQHYKNILIAAGK